MIHGGPLAAYSANFFDEAQVLAGAGYAVVMCNPRGSAGYGYEHGRVLKGAMGELDMVDVLAFLDHCLAADSTLDPDRVGVMGGSYGGFLAAWLIAQTPRFTAAIVERGYLDGRSMIGAADIGWYFPFEYQGGLAEIDQRSPLYQVHRVQTPTLLIHSEQDLRCPVTVAKRYYTELKLRGVETQLLLFPGEGHELSRSGTPQHRRLRFEHILAWWDRHLSS
jgi:dipeptidyl aminopeptidase/acylaminoacyl peptidase